MVYTLMHTCIVSKDDIEGLSFDELSDHLIEDKEFPSREIEILEVRVSKECSTGHENA